jgi:hypothetical protein
MRSIEARFSRFNKEPASSYLAFVRAIKHQNFSKRAIRSWFRKLVDKEDYEQDEIKAIFKNLERITKPSEECMSSGNTAE